MAGFNLGQYERVRLKRNGYTLEVCANRAIEPALAPHPETAETPPESRQREPEIVILPPELPQDPLARLQEIASEVASALEYMAARFGPPALPTLTVAPVPGRFGQGFPGLIYLSTMSYLAPQNKAIRSLDAHGRLFFSDILQAHETAHQWWGNVVTSAGYHDEWLMEALADYSALLYLENKNGSPPVAMALDYLQDQSAADGERPNRGIDRSDRAGHAAGKFAYAERVLQHHLWEGVVDHAHAAAADGRRWLSGHAGESAQGVRAQAAFDGRFPLAGCAFSAGAIGQPAVGGFLRPVGLRHGHSIAEAKLLGKGEGWGAAAERHPDAERCVDRL